jgi:hypothetical protein
MNIALKENYLDLPQFMTYGSFSFDWNKHEEITSWKKDLLTYTPEEEKVKIIDAKLNLIDYHK